MVKVAKQEHVTYTMDLSFEELGVITRALRTARDAYDVKFNSPTGSFEAKEWWRLEKGRVYGLREEILQQTERVT